MTIINIIYLKYSLFIYFIFCAFLSVTYAQNLVVLKPQASNYPFFENQFLAFDNNFDPLNFSIADVSVFIDKQEVSVDSILFQNASNSKNLELLIAMELSQATNSEDIDFINKFVKYLQLLPSLNTNKSIHIQLIAFNNNPILLWDNSNNEITDLNTVLTNPSYKRVDLNNFFNNPILAEFIQQKSDKSLILLSKSNAKLDFNFFQKQIVDNSIKFLNINLGRYKQSKYADFAQLTNTLYLNISDFSRIDNIFPSLIFLSLGGNLHKIYWQNILDANSHNLELHLSNLSDNIDFRVYNSEIPELIVNSSSYYFIVTNIGEQVTTKVRIESCSKNILVNSITCDNPKFNVENFSPNTLLKQNSILDLNVTYKPTDLQFEKAKLIIKTNTPYTYIINLSAGNKPPISETEINLQTPNDQDSLLAYENQRITWDGTFPLDEFKIDYNIKNDSIWNNITLNATGNNFLWKVPYFPDTLIKLKISQLDNNLISEKVIQLKGHKKKITSIAWSPNDSLICTASEDGTIILWETKTGNMIKTLFQSQTKIISGIDWSSDGKYLAISATDTVIKIWNVLDDILVKELKSQTKVNLIRFSPENDYLVGTLLNGNIAVWDFNQVEPKFIIQTGYNKIDAFALNPSSAFPFVATGYSDGKVLLWNYLNGTFYKETATLPNGVLNLSFSPSGNNIAVSSFDNKIRIYDINSSYNVLTLFDVYSPIIAINWLANKQFISSSLQNLIKLWSPADGNLKHIYDQHNSLVYLIQSSHNGKFISSVDESNIVQIWSPDDFPFYRPEILSKQTNYLKVLSKKLNISEINLPKMQIGDTLFYYYNNFIFNNSSFSVNLDTITLANKVKGFTSLNSLPYLNIDAKINVPIEFEYTPKDTFNIENEIIAKSSYLILNSKIKGFVSPRFYDIKKVLIDFGTVNLGESKDSSIFILQNISSNRFKIDSVKFISSYQNSFLLLNPTIPYELIEKGGAFVPKFKFSPKKIGLCSQIFRVFFQGLSPVDYYLYGKAVAPKIQSDSLLNFDNLICESFKKLTLNIKNIGQSNLIIKDISLENDINSEFNIANISSQNIKPGDSAYITIEFIPKNIGTKNVNLKLLTNLQESGDSINVIKLIGKKDSLSLTLVDKVLNFNPKDDNDKISHTATLNNFGNLIPTISIVYSPTYFIIDSIKSSFKDVKIYVTFAGGYHLPSYLDSLILSDDCNKTYSIKLIATFNNKTALADVQEMLNFGLLICENQKDTTITIKNIGNDTLLITDAFVSNNNFSINFPGNIKISSQSSTSLNLQFNPKNNLRYNDTLILSTNAINYSGGIIKIILLGEKDIFSYYFSNDTVYFKPIQTMSSDTIKFKFYNKSSFEIANKFVHINSNFDYITPELTRFLPNSEIDITSIFKGAFEAGKYFDKFSYVDSCGNEKSIYLVAEVVNSNEFFNIGLANPNPTPDNFSVIINSSKKIKYNYRLIDEIGRPLIQSNSIENSGNFEIKIELSSFSVGVYVLEINTDKGKFIRKIIKI